MKLTKENVCVFIENEQQLEEARKMLEKYGENIGVGIFFLSDNDEDLLQYFPAHDFWGLSYQSNETQITLQQLEEILKS